MALVAVHAVVHISLNALVILIRLRFRVAVSALENRVVVRIRMARRTHSIRVAMVNRELRVLRVIERRILPVRGVMAVLASGREKLWLRRMSRIRRLVVIRLVATDAGGRQRGVVVVDVAVGARPRGYRMRSRQRKRRVVVIERRIRPRDSVMTKLASGREARVRHRTFRIVEIILVARNAERAIQVVVIVHVAVRARPRRNRMGTRQRKTGLRVIELAIRPVDCVMAILASRREAGVRHWTFRIVVVGLVATDAGGRQRDVVVVDVAVGARPRRHHMRARQREWGVVVIEGRIRPGRRVMAHLASRREARVRHRTVCSGEIFLVARNAQRAVQVVVVVDVAVRARARGNSVTARQRETSLRVIELSIRPLHGVMALFAGGREAGVRHRTLRIVVVGLVARNARSVGDVVVVVDVAVGACPRRHLM